MAMIPVPKKHKTVRGYIIEVPSSKKDGSDDEEEDDEEDNWLDFSQIKNAFSEGTMVKRSKKPRVAKLKLQDLDDPEQTHNCAGRFALVDPWWEVTVHIGPDNSAQGTTLFAVRHDSDGIKKQNLVPYLLSTTLQRHLGFEEGNKTMVKFGDFIRNCNKTGQLTFEDLEPELMLFMQANPAYKDNVMKARNSNLMKAVLRGNTFPDLLRFLCRLFPLTFFNCLVAPMENMLPELQRASEKEPWVFGFKAILAARFKLYGIEASCQAFEIAGIMDNIPSAYKDALYIYDVLKNASYREGHTYVPFNVLQDHHHWKQCKHTVSDWLPALNFLTSSQATFEEHFDLKRNIFLYPNWRAEIEITEGLKEVLARGIEAKKPIWMVDFSSPDLASLRGDSDQWMAIQKMAGSPVCIMSGKGGCGKTTVVTKLIQHACRQHSLAAEKKFDEEASSSSPLDSDLQDCMDSQDAEEGDLFDSSVGCSKSSGHVTPEQVSEMIDSAKQILTEKQSQHRSTRKGSMEALVQIDLITDLIKYLGNTGDTAFSRTAVGRKILLTAPTGKAAKLLGHKAKMESCTLHSVVYSYRSFVMDQQVNKREEKEARETEERYNKGSTMRSTANSMKNTDKEKIQAMKGNDDSMYNDTGEKVWTYSKTEVLVVDECSLVPPRIFATVLKILLENTPLWKVVLLGDVKQLPSIEPGNFLFDVFTAFGNRGLGIELKTNHRSESELIVSNATRISRCQLPFIDPQRNFHFCPIEESKDSSDPERDAAVRQLLSEQQELCSHETSQFVAFKRADCDAINELCCKHYNSHSTLQKRGHKTVLEFCIGDKICFRKNGTVPNLRMRLRGYLKEFPDIQKALGISKARDSDKQTKEDGMDITGAVGHIMNTDRAEDVQGPAQTARERGRGRVENGSFTSFHSSTGSGYDASCCGKTEAEESAVLSQERSFTSCSKASFIGENEEEEESAGKLKDGSVRLCNGEVFFIMDDVRELVGENGKEHRYLVLSDRDPEYPRVVYTPYSTLKQECRVRHSWARTIHTYQGSESNTVVYYVGNSKLQNWKHVYTAVTRGRKAVFIVGTKTELDRAVKERDRPRRSRLQWRLTNMMNRLDFKELHAVVRGINEQAKAALSIPVPTAETPATWATLTTPTKVSSTVSQSMIDLDSFPDSDDSWVRDMSPVWAAEYAAQKGTQPPQTPETIDCLKSTFTQLRKTSHTTGKGLAPNVHGSDGNSASPRKRQLPFEHTKSSPPKSSHLLDPIDCIVTPVKRTLNI